MTYPHPDCMMPDGAEPCKGFTALNEALEAHKIMLTEGSLREGNLLVENDRLRAVIKNIATQKTSEELKAEGEQEYEDADFEGGYDALVHIARRAMQPSQ